MNDGSERLHALDAVRALALSLGIFFHASMSFMPGHGVWVIGDAERTPLLSGLFFVLHIFRMTTFFVIAGFFGRMVFHRRGLKAFARDRATRIVAPLVAGWPVVFGLIIATTIAANLIKYGGPPPFGPPPADPNPPLLAFPLTHLWFLWLLSIFYVLGLSGRAVVAALDRRGRLRGLADTVLSGFIRTGTAPLLLALPVALALNAYDGWRMWFGVPTPDNALIPNPAAFVGYGVAFTFGWLLQRRTDLLPTIQHWWPMHLVVALAATSWMLWTAGVTPFTGFRLPGVDGLAFAAVYGLAAWTWTFAFIGVALRFLSGFSASRRYLADASYWLYIIHLPVVILLQGLVARYAWPAELKYVLVLGVAFPLMLLSYETMVRHTWLGAILNGRRYPRPERSRIPATSVRQESTP